MEEIPQCVLRLSSARNCQRIGECSVMNVKETEPFQLQPAAHYLFSTIIHITCDQSLKQSLKQNSDQ